MPKAKVEELFDSLVPSRADELLAAADELSLREASELEPRRADIAVALDRGDRTTALDDLLEAFGTADEDLREHLRRAVIGILSELDPGDPEAIRYRRRLAAALY